MNNGDSENSGLLGWLIANLFHSFLGTVGTILLLITLALVLIRGYFSFSFYSFFKTIATYLTSYLAEQKKHFEEKRKDKEKRDHTSQLLGKLKERKEIEEETEEKVETAEEIEEIPESEIPQPKPEESSEEISREVETESEQTDTGTIKPPLWAIPEIETDDTSETKDGQENDKAAGSTQEEGTDAANQDAETIQIGEEVVEDEVDFDSLKPKVPRKNISCLLQIF